MDQSPLTKGTGSGPRLTEPRDKRYRVDDRRYWQALWSWMFPPLSIEAGAARTPFSLSWNLSTPPPGSPLSATSASYDSALPLTSAEPKTCRPFDPKSG